MIRLAGIFGRFGIPWDFFAAPGPLARAGGSLDIRKKRIENAVAIGDQVDPGDFAMFVRYLADERKNWPIALRVLHATDLGRSYLRRAQQIRPSLPIEGDGFDVKELANTLDAAALLDELVADSSYGPNTPVPHKWIWSRHWGYPPGNHPLYRIMVEIAHKREQREGAPLPKLERIGVVRRLIEKEWELERYAQAREKATLQAGNLFASIRLQLDKKKSKPRQKPQSPKGTE